MSIGIRWAVVVLAFLVLFATNVLTLVNNSFHVKAHNLFESVLGGVISTADSTINRTKALRDVNQQLVIVNQRLVATDTALRGALGVLGAATDLLQIRTQRLVVEHHKLSHMSAAQKTAAKGLVTKVVRRLAISVPRNVTSLFPRAVPMGGIAVSLAMTALDVNDACDTLRDLNVMNQAMGEEKHDDSKVCGVRVPNIQDLMRSIPKS